MGFVVVLAFLQRVFPTWNPAHILSFHIHC